MSERRWMLTLNLRDAYEAKKWRRTKRAINLIRQKAQRISKVKRVVIDEALSHVIWSRGVERPPRKVQVVIEKVDDETARVSLPTSGGEGEREEG
ncbi:MAG: 50S ribosomal protein L31e [Candidatus Caldarchaeales archaeon]